MKKTASALALFLALFVSLMAKVQSAESISKTINVPDDYTTITAAIQNASDGDMIFVRSGNYTESVEINKSISLIGEENKTTVITAPSGDVFSGQTPIKIFSNNVKVYNLTVINNNFMGTGISVSGNGTQLFGNTIVSPIAVYTRGPFTTISENYLSSSIASVQVATFQCKITHNILSSHNYGVDLEGSYNLVWNNTINGLHEANDFSSYGVFINGNSNNVSENVLVGENDGIHVGVYGSFNVVAANCITNCSEAGLRIGRWGFNNTFSENNVTECKYGVGISLGAYNNTIDHNNFIRNVEQAFAQAGVLNYWDSGNEGNYWSDFSTRYPNATEKDNSGVWDTPYVINANNTDNYPLTMPYGTSAPQPEQELFPTTLLLGSAIAVVAVVGLGLLVYLKKRQRNKSP